MVLCQLKINQILVIDFGEAKNVSVSDYYKAAAFEFGSVEDVDLVEQSDERERHQVDSNEHIQIRIHRSRGERVIDIFV